MNSKVALYILMACFTLACKKQNVQMEIENIPDQNHITNHYNEASERVLHWFHQMQNDFGLLETSYNSNVISLYDNALAALVFISNEDYENAEFIFDFFNQRIESELLQSPGGFYQFRNGEGEPYGNRWLGDNAWLLIALNNYADKTNSNTYSNLQNHLTDWIVSLQSESGGVNGGFTENNAIIGQVTEGNIDAFNAVRGYTDFHASILQFLHDERWNSEEKMLISWTNNVYEYALDNFAWGYCVFEDFPFSTLQQADMFKCVHSASINNNAVEGYCFDIDKDNIWLEGTGEMVVAFQKSNDILAANYFLQQMEKVMLGSTGLNNTLGMPYVTNQGTGYGNGPLWQSADLEPCVSSSAWYLFGIKNFNPFEVEYHKNIPLTEQFWME